MYKTLVCLCAVTLCGVSSHTFAARAQGQETATPVAIGLRDWAISGPCAHKNLAVYLVHGADLLQGRSFLTLQEALAQKKARVHETENVNELAIENLSDKEELFVQAGEIVRGGKQDRVLAVDLIVGPRSGKVPIGAFCVEAGRWTPREGEAAAYFATSDNLAPSNELKIAVVKGDSQGLVWRRVSEAQQRLQTNLGTNVADAQSPTSLELSLEQGKVQESAATYVKELSGAVQDKMDAVGIVVAIDGEIYSADVYASRQLFGKLLPKLLESSAIEAIARPQSKEPPSPPTLDAVRGVLIAAEDAKVSEKQVSPRIKIVMRESANWVITETLDGDTWIHRSYMKK